MGYNNYMPINRNLATAINDGAGNVALCYYHTTNPLVELGSGESYRVYKFVTQHNICLAWVKLEDAQRILNILGGCCGGKKPVYRVASETEVRRWTNGGR